MGQRLREAREVRGLQAVTLAEIANVSAQAISQYENAKSTPSPRVLSEIASALNLPEHYFTRPIRPDGGTIFFRSMSSATKAARARAGGRCGWLQDIAAYLSEFVDFPAPNFPELDVPSDPLLLSDDDIEQAAEEARRHWGMRDAPIGNVVRLLENQGALIARDAFGADTLDSLSQLVEGRPYMIIGTDKGTPARWRLDAAHELGHILLHPETPISALARKAEHAQLERQASRFAAAFLLPLGAFGDDLFAVSLDAFVALKSKWNVSVQMMIMRAAQAGFISEETQRRLWIGVSRRGWRRKEPLDDTTPPEEPKLLARAVELVLENSGTTAEDMSLAVGLPIGDIESLCGLPRGALSRERIRLNLRSQAGGTAEVVPFKRRPEGSS